VVGRDETREGRIVQLISAATIAPLETEYVFPPYVPRGEVTWFEGVTKSGKTMAALDLIARLTRGDAFNGTDLAKGRAAIITAEDDPSRTIIPRLIAASADLARVELVRVTEDGVDRTPSFLHDLGGLQRALATMQADLVFIDGTFAMLGTQDGNSYVEAYARMGPFVAMVRELGIGAILVRHVTKSDGTALNKGIGSVGYASIARSTVSIGPDKNDPSRRLFSHAGSNVGETGPTIGFTIEGIEIPSFKGTVGRVAWGDTVDVTADEVMAAGTAEDGGVRDAAADLIRDELANGPRPSADVYDSARKAGFARATTLRAAKRIHVVMEQSGFPRRTSWSLAEPHSLQRNPLAVAIEATEATEATVNSVASIKSKKIERG